jgi:hypothetical protein
MHLMIVCVAGACILPWPVTAVQAAGFTRHSRSPSIWQSKKYVLANSYFFDSRMKHDLLFCNRSLLLLVLV